MTGTTMRRRPTFAAEAAIGRGTRSYRHVAASGAAGIAPAVSAVSGYYVGTVCMGGTLCVMVEDFDENGNVVGWHCVDEIASC